MGYKLFLVLVFIAIMAGLV